MSESVPLLPITSQEKYASGVPTPITIPEYDFDDNILNYPNDEDYDLDPFYTSSSYGQVKARQDLRYLRQQKEKKKRNKHKNKTKNRYGSRNNDTNTNEDRRRTYKLVFGLVGVWSFVVSIILLGVLIYYNRFGGIPRILGGSKGQHLMDKIFPRHNSHHNTDKNNNANWALDDCTTHIGKYNSDASCATSAECCGTNYCEWYTEGSPFPAMVGRCAECRATGEECSDGDQCCTGKCSKNGPNYECSDDT